MNKHNVKRGVRIFEELSNGDNIGANINGRGTSKSGRNPILIAERNKFLLHRFYYKSKIERKQYSIVIDELALELFLSPSMIQKIITLNSNQILNIKKQQPDIKYFKSVWTNVVW